MHNFISTKREEFIQSDVDINAIGIKDIIFLFITFSFVLYILFPKETLKEKVLKETKSNDLALVYIENMINFDYKNYELLLHYADMQFKDENFAAVKGIVGTLLKLDNKETQKSALILGEKLFKREYFQLEEQEDKEKLLKEYQDILKDMVLISEDEQFQNDILSYFSTSKDRDEYIKLLEKLSKIDDKWELKLTEYYMANNKLQKALILYKKRISKDIPYKEKKVVFKKIIKVLMFGSFFDEGTKIMQKYENLFIEDEEIFEEIIRFYISAGEEKKARKYILKRGKY
jgi:hypothetical protein